MTFLEQATENQLHDWFLDAQLGQSFVYFRGHLARDRSPEVSRIRSSTEVILLGYMANKVLKMASGRLLLLAQRRHGDCDYEYLATKAKIR